MTIKQEMEMEDKKIHKKQKHTSAWRPACNLTPEESYITCQQILYIRCMKLYA